MLEIWCLRNVSQFCIKAFSTAELDLVWIKIRLCSINWISYNDGIFQVKLTWWIFRGLFLTMSVWFSRERERERASPSEQFFKLEHRKRTLDEGANTWELASYFFEWALESA